jgi:NADPH2:quinone reductase
VIDYTREDFGACVREETDGRGVDVVLDTVGGEVFSESLRVLAPLGTLVAIGFAGGAWPSVDPAFVVGRNVTLIGFFLGRLFRLAPAFVAEATAELVELWRNGAVRPIVTGRFALADAAKAHRAIESRRTTGKIVLLP